MAKKKRARRGAEPRPRKTAVPPRGKKKSAKRAASPRRSKPAAASTDKSALAVVGIGASAGGLDAFKQFFTAMSHDSGLAFVLIQHLDPTHKSLTPELLGKVTRMSVVQVTDKMRVEPNHVYVIPPNKYLAISGETLHLTEPFERRGVRVPIDFFFRSLANDQQERGIGIVLSGTGSDGTLGVREIKAAGGMVMVQAPGSGQHDGMPRSAIAAGVADHVLPPDKMPDVLIRYVQHRYVNGGDALTPDGELKLSGSMDNLQAIIRLLRTRFKYDFSSYKKGTLIRRVQRRMGLKHIEEMGDYTVLLRRDDNEVSALYQDLLISVTNFFREPDAWQVLEKEVIEPLVRSHDAVSPIRVWVPGCATGEEAYSVAMLMTEQLQAVDKSCPLQIFASDIDQSALAFARAGIYPENIAADVPPERLRQFFMKGEHTFRINKEIRETVVFAEQNVISDPPFSKLDLVSCRNLMIYLEADLQKKIVAMFHFTLNEGGFLFLGGSETIGQQKNMFQPVSHKNRIYRRIGSAQLNQIDLPVATARTAVHRSVDASRDLISKPHRSLQPLAQHLMLQRFAPACVLINRKLEVLFLNGPIDRYLQLPPGELASDLMAMARPGLRTKLRAAIQQAIREDCTVSLNGLRVTRDGKRYAVRLVVEPIHQPREAQGLLMVAFDEESDDVRSRLEHVEQQTRATADEPENPNEYESLIHQLEDELRITREELQSTIEELETSNEEFKASNEEVVSINEELQSTNEELETSQEELRSLNEELQTVNNQLEQKVGELESANNDLSNLLSSTEIATLCLDRQLRIKWFTPTLTRLVKLREWDAGRPLADFAQQFTDAELLPDAELVLQRLTSVEKQIQSNSGDWYLRRISPYRTEDDRIDGVVITFIDITRQKQDAFDLQASQERFMQFMQHLPGLAWIKDREGRYVYCNAAAEEAFQIPRSRLYGKTDIEVFPAESAAQFQANDREAIASSTGIQSIETLKHADGIVHRSIVAKFPIADAEGTVGFVGGMAVDITELLETQESLREAQQQLRLVTDSMGVAVIRCSRDLKFLWVNRHCADWLGFSPEQMVGRPLVEFLGEKACEQIQPYIEKVLSGQKVSFEQQIDYQGPGRRWIRAVYSPTFDASGQVDGWVAVIIDITDQKLTEQGLLEREALRIARLEASLDAIVSVDHAGKILEWNPAAEKMFGLMRDDVLGQEMAALIIPSRLREQHRAGLARYRDTGEGPVLGRLMEFPALRRDGTEFPAEIAIARVGTDEPPTFTGFVRDITERKRAETALRESEERLRLATEGAEIGTWQWQLETNQTSWSEIESKLLGCDPAVPHTNVQDFFDCVHPDDLEGLRSAIDRAIEREEPYAHEFRVVLPNGQSRWLAGKGEVFRDDKGKPVQMMGVNIDIDDRKRAEERLADLNDQLKELVAERTANTDRLLEEAPDAVVIVNRQGRIIRINQLLVTMFGYSRDELLGETIEMLLPEYARARHPQLRDSYFADPRVRAMGLGFDLTARHQDGYEFHVEIQLTPLVIDGQPVAAASIRDMSERKQFQETQARLGAIMKNTSTALWVMDLDGTVLHWNRGAERLFGYSAGEAVGQHISRLVPLERTEEVQWDIDQLVGGQLEVDYDTVRLHKNGTPIDVSITKTLIRQNEGGTEILVIARDIREQKRLGQQIAELTDTERQRMGRELHDSVGQECTAISMLVATLKQQPSDSPKRAETLDRLDKCAETARKQLRRLNRGLLPVDLDADGLRVALEELAEETHQSHDVNCSFECPAPIALEDNFVATQLYQIVREAVHNAIKHSGAKQIVIRVEDDNGIYVAIRDDGVGIEQAAADLSAGMGLRIMRYRCGLIGGRIRFDSQHGGTLVEIALPRNKTQEDKYQEGKNQEEKAQEDSEQDTN